MGRARLPAGRPARGGRPGKSARLPAAPSAFHGLPHGGAPRAGPGHHSLPSAARRVCEAGSAEARHGGALHAPRLRKAAAAGGRGRGNRPRARPARSRTAGACGGAVPRTAGGRRRPQAQPRQGGGTWDTSNPNKKAEPTNRQGRCGAAGPRTRRIRTRGTALPPLPRRRTLPPHPPCAPAPGPALSAAAPVSRGIWCV